MSNDKVTAPKQSEELRNQVSYVTLSTRKQIKMTRIQDGMEEIQTPVEEFLSPDTVSLFEVHGGLVSSSKDPFLS